MTNKTINIPPEEYQDLALTGMGQKLTDLFPDGIVAFFNEKGEIVDVRNPDMLGLMYKKPISIKDLQKAYEMQEKANEVFDILGWKKL